MPETYTTEQIMLLAGLTRRGVYAMDNRYNWSSGIARPNPRQKLYDTGKVSQYLQARAITAQAQRQLHYGKTASLLWPVTTCPRCGKPASYIRTSIFCIEGHQTD